MSANQGVRVLLGLWVDNPPRRRADQTRSAPHPLYVSISDSASASASDSIPEAKLASEARQAGLLPFLASSAADMKR